MNYAYCADSPAHKGTPLRYIRVLREKHAPHVRRKDKAKVRPPAVKRHLLMLREGLASLWRSRGAPSRTDESPAKNTPAPGTAQLR